MVASHHRVVTCSFAAGYPHIVVHTPTHASWLNQIELYFSIVQRKVLTPLHAGRVAVAERSSSSRSAHRRPAVPLEFSVRICKIVCRLLPTPSQKL